MDERKEKFERIINRKIESLSKKIYKCDLLKDDEVSTILKNLKDSKKFFKNFDEVGDMRDILRILNDLEFDLDEEFKINIKSYFYFENSPNFYKDLFK